MGEAPQRFWGAVCDALLSLRVLVWEVNSPSELRL